MKKHDKQHREVYEKSDKSAVDTTGYQPLEQRIRQLQQAGIILNTAKDQLQYDSFEENPPDNLRAIPLAGASPDLADFAQLQRENAERITLLKERQRELRAQWLEENPQEEKPEGNEATKLEKAPKEPKAGDK